MTASAARTPSQPHPNPLVELLRTAQQQLGTSQGELLATQQQLQMSQAVTDSRVEDLIRAHVARDAFLDTLGVSVRRSERLIEAIARKLGISEAP